MTTPTDTVQTLADHRDASDHYADFSGIAPFVFVGIIAALVAVGLPLALGVVAMAVK